MVIYSVLGYDNVAYAESALVPLSTVSQTLYQLGYTMGEQMLSELTADETHLHQHVVFQPQIVERASTRKMTILNLDLDWLFPVLI